MIVSASRRTDIPAFYSPWFMNRLREGYVLIRNPFRPSQCSRVSLDPANVEAIVFWTRNAEPLILHLHDLDRMGYRYYFQYTVVQYPRVFERSTVALAKKLERFRKLSQTVGPEKAVWRYDPVILSNLTDLGYHKNRFEEIAKALSGFTDRCVISFLDVYQKTRRTLHDLERKKGIRVVDLHHQEATVRELCRVFAQIGKACGIQLLTCAEPFDLEGFGIHHGKCIDDQRLNNLFGLGLSIAKDRGQRKLCRCAESKDIGAYDTCPYGCVYCYANTSVESARRNFHRHDSRAPLLL